MSAVFSSCGLYRFRLDRDLGRSGPTVAILGVNPSRAGAVENDATIRKDIGFGERLGSGRLKGNKFALIATDIADLRRCDDPIGPENDAHLEQIMRYLSTCGRAGVQFAESPIGSAAACSPLARRRTASPATPSCWPTARSYRHGTGHYERQAHTAQCHRLERNSSAIMTVELIHESPWSASEIGQTSRPAAGTVASKELPMQPKD